jgi:hypothetical protein
MGRNMRKTGDYRILDDASTIPRAGTGGLLSVIHNATGITLFSAFNDSLMDLLLEAYYTGYEKGKKDGRKKARFDICYAIGAKPVDDKEDDE